MTRKGIVASERRSAWAGAEMIRKGGNAVDAAVAAAIAESASAPADNGFGGYGGGMVIYLARKKKVVAIDYNTRAPSGVKIDSIRKFGENCGRSWLGKGRFLCDYNLSGWDFIGIPGTLSGLVLALEKYGTKTWTEAFAPSLEIVRDGIEVNKTLYDAVNGNKELIADRKEWAEELFINGRQPQIGETLPMKNFRETLSVLSEKGPGAFYNGEIGESVSGEIQRNGGVLSIDDLTRFQAAEKNPLSTTFAGYEIFTPPACLGGVSVLQFVNLFEELSRASGVSLKETLLIHKKAWEDRLTLLGDTDFTEDCSFLISKDYAQKSAREINSNLDENLFKDPSPGTIHISTADSDGNMVALTQTRGGGIDAPLNFAAETGLFLNKGLGLFDPRPGMPNCMEPWKQPLVNMAPLIVLKDGEPAYTLGTPGARRIVSTLSQMLVDLLYYKKDMQEIIDAPRLHYDGMEEVVLEPGFAPAMKSEILKTGLNIKEESGISGPAHIVSFEQESMRGATDFRNDGGAIDSLF